MLEGVCHHGICVLQTGQNQALLHTKKSRDFFSLGNGAMPILSCREKLGGVHRMVLPRDTLDGGSLWALLPPPPPQMVLEWGHGTLGTAVVGDSCGSWDREYLQGQIF